MSRRFITCQQCHKEKPSESYERRRTPKGKPYRLRTCSDCKPEPKRHNVGNGPWKADSDCKQCGKEIWRLGTYCRVKLLLYCSDRCDRLMRRKNVRKCLRCERKLPFEQFDRPPTANKHRKRCCRSCVEKATLDQVDGVKRTGPSALLKTSKWLAKRANKEHTLKIADTRRIYDGECHLCGKAPYSLQLQNLKGGYTPDNVYGLCLRCKTSVRNHGMSEVLTWSLEIASRHFREQLILPEHREAKACEKCGHLPIGEAQARHRRRQAEQEALEEQPQGADRIVAALHEHVY